MKVSEAVKRLREELQNLPDNPVSVTWSADLLALLNSHEALRLAAGNLIAANHPEGSIQDFAEAHEALSRAHQEASE